jgi:hypothetical protein
MRIDYSQEANASIININDITDNHFVCGEFYAVDEPGEVAYMLAGTDRGYGFVGIRSLNIDEIDYFRTIQEAIIDFIDVPDYEQATVRVFTSIQEVQKWFYELKFPK